MNIVWVIALETHLVTLVGCEECLHGAWGKVYMMILPGFETYSGRNEQGMPPREGLIWS